MSKKTLITVFLTISILAAGLFGWQHLYSDEKVLRIYDYFTQKEYVRYPVKTGDKIFFGWIHSWERISWHEYYHINADNTLELETISLWEAIGCNFAVLLNFTHVLMESVSSADSPPTV